MIKVLKALCIFFGSVFFTGMIAVLMMFNVKTIEDIKVAIFLGFILFLLMVACRMAHWILCDHEENIKDKYRSLGIIKR